jgi:hypothetical protein
MIASKKTKHIGINFIKDVNDFNKENHKPLKKVIEADYRRWKDPPYTRIGRINIVKMDILPKGIYIVLGFLARAIRQEEEIKGI